MNRVRLALFEKAAQAERICDRLRRSGVLAEVHPESALAALWYVSPRRAVIRLDVAAGDRERAKALLDQWDREPGWCCGAIRCPECKSLRVEYPQLTEKSLLTNFVLGLAAEFRLIEREYYCEDCHCMWARERAHPAHPRAHMAPDYFLQDVRRRPFGAEETDAKDRARVSAWLGRKTKTGQDSQAVMSQKRLNKLTWWSKKVKLAGSLVAVLLLTKPLFLPSGAKAAVPNDSGPQRALSEKQTPTFTRDVLPILMGKCARCHNDQARMLRNLLDYRSVCADRTEIQRRVWDSWKGSYFKQPMPAANSPESELMTERERRTIRKWLESGMAYGAPSVASSGAHSKAERIELGQRLFATVCAACHQPTGQGLPGRFPPLAGSDFLNSDKHRAIRIVVNGLQGQITVKGQQFNNVMPKFPLSDDDIANALTYVYNSFGNSGKEVTPEEVKAVRSERSTELVANERNQTAKVPEQKSPYE